MLITGRNTKTLDAAVSALGAGTLAIHSDVSKVQDIDRLFSVVGSKLGKIDVLFANAAIAKFAPYTASQETLFDELFATNVKGVYFILKRRFLVVVLGVIKQPGEQINYGTGKDVGDETVADAGEPLAAQVAQRQLHRCSGPPLRRRVVS